MIRDDNDAFGGRAITSSENPLATPDTSEEVDVGTLGRLARARRRLGAVVTLLTRRS